MAARFEISNNSLVVTDTVTSAVIFDRPAASVYYDLDELNNDRVVITNNNALDPKANPLFTRDLADSQNASAVTFTTTTFRAFANEFLGNSTGGGNGGGVVPTNDHIFASVSERDSHFATRLSELIAGTPIFVGGVTLPQGGTGTALQEWGGQSNPSSYDNTQWAQGGILSLTPIQIKSLYESNSDTNAFTDALLVKLNAVKLYPSLTEESDRIVSTKTIVTPDASLQIGNWQLSNYGFAIGAEELASESVFLPISYELTSSGSQLPIMLDFAAEAVAPVTNATNADETFTGNMQFTTPVLNTGIALDYRLTSAVNTLDCNIIIRLNSHTDEPAVFNYKRSTGGTGFDLSVGQNTILLPNPLFFRQGVPLFVTIESTNALSLQGETVGGQQIPFATGNAQLAVDEIIATRSWVNELIVDDLISTSPTNALSANQGRALNTRLSTLENTAFNSGRSFVRFNDGFTIDRNNLATFEDKNIIYTAKNDKPITSPTRPDVVLPNDAEIAASGEAYPIVFEFTHLGGSARITDGQSNVVRFVIDGVISSTTLFRDDIAIVTKEGVGQDYSIQVGEFDPNDTLLPTGVFNLKTDTPIDDISTIATELSGITIVAGDAYLVEIGGTWSGLTVPNNSVLVALVNSASLTDSLTNNDWLLLDNPRVNAKSAALLANFAQDGIVFSANRNIKVDPTNVTIFNSLATGTPITRQIGTNTQGFNRQIRYDNVPIQLADIVGGKLQLMFSIQTTRSSGFEIEPIDITLHYSDTIQFVFPLNTFQIDSGNVLLEIDIPNSDYSSILNTDVSLRFNYNFRGATYLGNMIVSGLVNIAKGNLHDPIVSIADQRAQLVRAELDTKITNLIGDIDAEHQNLGAIEYRISPIRRVSTNTPDITARFADDTGGAFPTNPTQVSTDNPQFQCGQTSCFVYTVGGGTYALSNVTQNTIVPLIDGNSIASTQIGDLTYFVHRVAVAVNDILEVETVNSSNVAAWQDDINSLKDGLDRVDAELEHAALNLPEALVQVLENETTVTEETNATVVSTPYNNGLGDTGTQTVFYETNPNAASGGLINSKPISDTTGDRARRKLIYYPDTTTFNNEATLVAFDGTTGRDLIRYGNGIFSAQVFVPAVSAGTATSTIYPAPSNRISGSGIWQTIPTLTFVNGIPVPEADELFFTRNIPATSVAVTVNYRGHANGNIFGAGSITLPANQNSVTFTLNDGSETATVEVLRRNNEIRVSTTERVNAGLPTINDIQVILSYTETRTVPAVPATVREVPIESVSQGYQVFAIKPSATNTLILVGDNTEIDTGYLYTTLFGASEGGHLISAEETSTFLDYEDFNPIDSTIRDLENHATLPQFGLFTTQYTRETLLNLGITIRPDGINVGNLPTSATGLVAGDLWNNGGVLTIV